MDRADSGAAAGPLVCGGLACRLAGAPDDGTVPCLGRCDQAPAVLEGGEDGGVAAPNLVTYTLQGGYRLLRSCLDGRRSPEEVIAVLHDSGLRGLGGGGGATAGKWRRVKNLPGRHVLVADATERTPGSFKDRAYLEHDPHRFLEGLLVAGWAVDAAELIICLRPEYPHLQPLLDKEIAAAAASGLTGGRSVALRLAAAPPSPDATATLCHNAETLYWVRDIVEAGADWWRGFGRRGRHGLRSFSVSGRVAEPGVKVAPAGITARELVDELSGGMAEGHALGACVLGDGGVLAGDLLDLPLDFDTLEPHGLSLGAAVLTVLGAEDRERIQGSAATIVRT